MSIFFAAQIMKRDRPFIRGRGWATNWHGGGGASEVLPLQKGREGAKRFGHAEGGHKQF